jgi:hypothetical protein
VSAASCHRVRCLGETEGYLGMGIAVARPGTPVVVLTCVKWHGRKLAPCYSRHIVRPTPASDDLKRCTKCGEEKPPADFSRDRSRKDGRYPQCKACVSRWHRENAERLAEYNRRWREANRDKQRAWGRRYRERKRARLTQPPPEADDS